MAVHVLSSSDDLAVYDAWVRSHPYGSLWQSIAWKTYQDALGRETRIYVDKASGGSFAASALVVIDRTAFNWCTWDMPRGPLWTNADVLPALIQTIAKEARKDHCLSLYLSPLQELAACRLPLAASSRHLYPQATRVLDIQLPEELILAQMKPKGRYNIGLAHRHGVRVERSEDVETFHALLEKTAARDKFTPLPLQAYRTFLARIPGSFLFMAYHPDPNIQEPLAGLIGAIWGQMGIYYYGASSASHRDLMAPYALQWAAMRHCKSQECRFYDLLGIAPEHAPADHPWQGVSAFKEKFGGIMAAFPPEQQLCLRPIRERLLKTKRALAH